MRRGAQVTRIQGEIPHGHPFVDALVRATNADLRLSGSSSMMVLPLHLDALIARAAPEAEEVGPPAAQDLDLPAPLRRVLRPGPGARPPRPRVPLEAGEVRQLEEWFPRREVIFWASDHF